MYKLKKEIIYKRKGEFFVHSINFIMKHIVLKAK